MFVYRRLPFISTAFVSNHPVGIGRCEETSFVGLLKVFRDFADPYRTLSIPIPRQFEWQSFGSTHVYLNGNFISKI